MTNTFVRQSNHAHRRARSRAGSVIGASFLAGAMVLGAVVGGTGLGATPSHAAATVTVNNANELRTEFDGATADTVIVLGSAFPDELPATVALTNSSGAHIAVDGAGKSLLSPPSGAHLSLEVGGTGSVTVSDLTLSPSAGAASGGLSLSQADSAAATLERVTLTGMSSTALHIGGGGDGPLLVEDVTLAQNAASSAAALAFSRHNPAQSSVLNRVSVTDNVSRGGYGYSGGAVRIGAESAGAVQINNSLFRDNAFDDGGAQPRGGAIAMHNSNVQLSVNGSYFTGNSTSSVGTPASADGGAISVFNSDANRSGSLTVLNSSFVGNTAQDDGAAIFIEGQNASNTLPFPTKLTVVNSTFADNESGDAGGNDTGGAIQASLRVEVAISNSSFSGNTKAGGRAGVDIGVHTNLLGTQRPVGALTDNIFTSEASLAGVLASGLTCSGGVGCKINAGAEAAVGLGVYGTDAPAAAANDTAVIAGDGRDTGERFAVPTLALAPPLTDETPTAWRIVEPGSGMVADQRGVAYRASGQLDAGSYTMDFVRYDAATNGGSWADLTPTPPPATGTFVSDATATHGWFEIVAPGGTAALPSTDPTPPAGAEFLGWFDSPTGGNPVTSPLADGQVVYAQYGDAAPAEHTVTFDPANGEATFTQTVIHGAVAEQPTSEPTREGYEFTGWTLDGAAYDFTTEVTGDITLVATWTPVKVPPTTEPPTTGTEQPGPGGQTPPALTETGGQPLAPALVVAVALVLVAGAAAVVSGRRARRTR